MKIKTGEIVDKNKDKNVVSSVKLSKGTRVGTLKLTVNGEEQDSVPIRGLGGGSSTVIGGSVDTQALWDAINKKVDIDFFKNLFTVYDSSDIEIATNTYTRKPDNLKISVGTWTEEYLSALGKNSEDGGSGGVGTVIGIALGTGTTPIYPDDDTGIVTLPAYPTKVSQLANDSGFVTSSTLNNYVTSSYLANNFYTKAQADSKYMTIAAFESLFNALDSNGDKINHPYSSGVDSIKALVGLWTEEYLSALGQNSEGGSSGGGSVNAIKVGTNPDTYLDPVEGIIDMSNYVTTAAQRTLWTNSAHTHSNKAVLDNITAGQVAAWNNMAAIMEEDQDNIINKWNEVVDFLSTYTEADTLANLLSNKLDVEFFRRIFTVYDEDGNTIVPNTYTQAADNLKILVGAWTEEYLSALGKNSEGGGGGTGTVTSVKIASNPDVFIDPVDGIIDMSSYATTWNNKQDAISDLATIRSNASNGNTAYSWGNHANAGYAQASNTVSNVAYNTTGKKLTKTINGNTTDIVSASTLVTDGGGAKASTTITAGNGLTGGGDLSSNRTINVVSANAAITVNADNIQLNVINDYTTTTNNTIIPLAAAKGKDLNDRLAVLESWFEVDSDGNVKTKDKPNNGGHRGFYTESFVSALGSNSEGGGSSTFDEEQMWAALQSTTGTYATTKIATSHIPDMASTYGYLKSSALNGYATQSWVNQQGFLTTHQSIYALTLKAGGTAVTTFTPNSASASLDFVAGTNISLTRGTNQITIANTYSYTLPLAASGTRGGVQIGYSESNSGTSTTRNYAVKLSSEKMYVNVPWTDTTYKLTLNGTTNGASGGTSLGSFYAPTASGTANQVLISGGSNTAPSWTAQSNLSVGTAAKLGTGTTTYTAWGQTYWSSGVPQSISGNMTSVGSITPSANGNALGTTSARFNIFGYAGNFSGNVSISGTLGVTGATTLSSTLSVAGGITLTTTKKIYFGDTSHYLELDSTGFHFSHGVYSDSFVSALGANSSGGGGSGTFDEEAMWTALGTTSTAKVIASSHIPNLSWAKITSGKPTTLSGYGITNAYTKTQVDTALSGYLPLSGGTLTGDVTFNGINKGIYLTDNEGNTFAGIIQNAENLWIGARATDATHHAGSILLSAGSGSAYVSRLVNDTRANYIILDSGNYSSYALPLSGGTITVPSNDSLVLKKSTNTVSMIRYEGSSGLLGYLGFYVNSPACNIEGTYYDLVHAGNYDSVIGNSYIRRKTYGLDGGKAVRITFNNVNGGIINVRSTLSGASLILVGNGYGEGGTTRNNWVQLSSTTSYFSWCIPTASGIGKSVEIYNSSSNSASVVVAAFDTGVTFTELSALSTTASTVKVAYASDYLPLTGGTLTGGISIKFDTDSSREKGYNWLNTSETRVASVTYHNTAQNIILNPVGSANTYSDAVGKYSLIVGNNSLTYNTYPILHSNNYSSYALPLSGGTLTGSLHVATGYGISDATGNGLLVYKPATTWGGISSTQWGVGAVDVQGVIRSNTSDLIHYKNGTSYAICDGSNTYVSSGIGYINGTAITHLSHLSLVSGGTLNSTAGSFAWSSGSIIYSGNDNVGIQVGDSVDKWQLTADSHLHFRQNDSGGTNSTAWGNWLQILDTGNLSFSRTGDVLKVTMGGTTSNITNILERPETGNFTTSGSGWYRVAQFANSGAHGNSVLLYLNRTFNHANNESFIFAITTMYSGLVNITRLAGTYNSQYFTKIRVDNPNSGYGYIDIYYGGGTNVNDVHITTIGSAYTLSTFALNPTTVGTLTEFSVANMPGMEAKNLTVINAASNTANDAMVYFENKSSDDWAMKIECGTYGYGLKITATASNALEVYGTIYASSEITAASDERAKNVLGDANLDLRYIADAPNVLYEWKDASIHGKGIHGGSLAQYWLKNERSQYFVSQDKDSGLYSLNYGALGTSLAISVAKYVLKHEDEITRLKKEVVKLRERVAELEERRA